MTAKPHSATDWAVQTWPEILERIEKGCDAVLLPLGATEQHGPHLACGMDACIAAQLALEVSRRTGVPSLPALPYGCSIAHSHRWPGTVALSPTTLIAVLCDMGEWLYRAGIRRLFFINGHVGNAAPIRCAIDTLRARFDDFMLASFNDGDLTPEIAARFRADGDDWHANAAETSLMLALAPELVREDKLSCSDDPDRTPSLVFAHPVNRTSQNGVTGRPSEASAEQGQELFALMADALEAKVHAGLQERPPLNASYFQRIQTSDVS